MLVLRARSALIMAAMRRSLVAYGELGRAIGMRDAAVRNELRHVLDDLSLDCVDRGDPPLEMLVVNRRTGAPMQGWSGSQRAWHAELHSVFRAWPPN